MPIDYNEIKDNTGKIYLLKNGLARDPLNLDSYHPLSTTDGFMPHIEDGVAGNIVLANYRPNKKATWASHWFPLWYRGLTEKQITGEGYSRTFAQYFSYIPAILSAMNKNADAIMDVDVTIVQYKGDNLLGGYSSVLALETAHQATEALNLDHSVAYVYDASEKGFYTSQWNTEGEKWEWTLVTMPLQSYGVQMKQYNTFTIKVQRGFAPTDAQYNTTWTDEQIRLTWQEMAYLEATLAEHTELLATFEAHLTDYENPHQVSADQVAFDNTGTDLVAVQTEEAIKEVNVKANANAQNIEDMKDGTDKFTSLTVTDGSGNDMVITFNGTDPIVSYRGITGELFKNLFLEVEPASGVTFTNGMAVMYAGSIGASGKRLAKPTVLSELKVNPSLFLGVITEVTTDGYGIVNWYGEVNGLNTSGLTLGVPVYVGDNGTWTTTKPTSPNPQISIGLIERVNPSQGRISVRPIIRGYLGQLYDVYTNGHTFVGGETIKFNISTGRYEIYDLDGLIARVGDLETANMIKSIARTGTNLITITYYDDTTSTVITLAELKAFIGEATTSLSGLMSATDKTNLNTLMALFDSDADDVVNTIAEILAIFEAYPEGVDLVTALAGKEDLTNKATDFSTINDTKYPSVQAVRNYVRDIGLDTPIAELNNHSLREVFEVSSLFDSYQLLTNGDFTYGITGWTSVYVSTSIVSNNAILTGLGTNLAMSLRSGTMIVNNGTKIYQAIRLRTLSAGTLLLRHQGYAGYNQIVVNNPVQNQWYFLSKMFTGNADTQANAYRIVDIEQTFVDSATQLNKQMEIDYAYAFNISSLITNQQYSPMFNTTFDLMSDVNIKSQMDEFFAKPYLFIDYETLGIDTLTTAQMDYWYGVYQALSTSTTYGFLNTLYDLFTSKASIAQEAWITPTLTTATTTYLKYRKDTLGTVIIEGNLTVTTAGTNFTLPTGYRPLFAYVQGDLTFNTNGTVVSASTGLKYINVRFTGGA